MITDILRESVETVFEHKPTKVGHKYIYKSVYIKVMAKYFEFCKAQIKLYSLYLHEQMRNEQEGSDGDDTDE